MSALPEPSPYARVVANLRALGLESMASSVGDYMRMCAEGSVDLARALLEMTGAELGAKDARDEARRVEKAGFPYVKTLADFDFSFQPSLPRGVVEELATLRFLERAENVVLVGNPGVGKTHLAVALGIEAVRARRLVYFTDCARLVGDLERASEKGMLERRLRFYSHLALLIVDELGYLDVGPRGADLLFQLVSRRYERASTIVTTNVPVGGWAGVFGNPVTANAVADRLCHHCTLVKIVGRSYRTKDLPADPPGQGAGNGQSA